VTELTQRNLAEFRAAVEVASVGRLFGGRSASRRHPRMDLARHRVDPFDQGSDGLGEVGVLLKQGLHALGQRRVLLHHFEQHARLLAHLRLPLLTDLVEFLAVLGVGEARHLVPVGLTGLRQQDQGRGIGRLGREGEVEQNERIKVELGPAGGIDPDPQRDDQRLGDQEGRRPEEAREIFRFSPEPVVSEGRFEMGVRQVKSACALGLFLRHAHWVFPSPPAA
jgi:hypothetical protein